MVSRAKAGAPTQVRMGQTLFAFAGGSFKRQDANIDRARASCSRAISPRRTRRCATAFGAAALPDERSPPGSE